jgi:ABC-type amino acid transport system permease subunit
MNNIEENIGPSKRTVNDNPQKARKGILRSSLLAIAIGCLCCITPLVIVLLGLASLSTAASVDSTLSGQYVWVFRGTALLLLGAALVVYFRRRGVGTLDEARRQRNRIINTALLTLLFAIGGYIVFEYILLSYFGEAVGLPWTVESWTFPVAGVLLGAGAVLYLAVFRRGKRR